jgi:hypothetical protein
MNEGNKISEEELAYREALRIANTRFEEARSQSDREENIEALERTIRDRIKLLAGRLLNPPVDTDPG